MRIGNEAFKNTGIKSIVIPNTITHFGIFMFAFCTKLKEIRFCNLTEIPEGMFFMSSIADVVVPEGITKLCKHSFGECSSLTKLTLPNSLKVIENGAIDGTSIKNICLPENIEDVNLDLYFSRTETVDFSNVENLNKLTNQELRKKFHMNDGIKIYNKIQIGFYIGFY